MSRLVGLALLWLGSVACEPKGDEPTQPSDGGAPLSVQPYLYLAQGAGYATIEPGGEIELWAAPQGGHWARVGARVGGLETDAAELVARLVDPETKAVVVEATRTAPMVAAADAPGWKQPDPTDMYNVVHLPLCPGEGGRALDGGSFWLEVEVTELYGDFSTGSVSVPVVPRCQQAPGADLDYCRCECAGDYLPGKCASPSGG